MMRGYGSSGHYDGGVRQGAGTPWILPSERRQTVNTGNDPHHMPDVQGSQPKHRSNRSRKISVVVPEPEDAWKSPALVAVASLRLRLRNWGLDKTWYPAFAKVPDHPRTSRLPGSMQVVPGDALAAQNVRSYPATLRSPLRERNTVAEAGSHPPSNSAKAPASTGPLSPSDAAPFPDQAPRASPATSVPSALPGTRSST